jgi:hypothetical protein
MATLEGDQQFGSNVGLIRRESVDDREAMFSFRGATLARRGTGTTASRTTASRTSIVEKVVDALPVVPA